MAVKQDLAALNEDWVEVLGMLNPDWVEMLMGAPQGWTRADGHVDKERPSAKRSLREQ